MIAINYTKPCRAQAELAPSTGLFMGCRGPGEAGPIVWRGIPGLQRFQGCALHPARVSRVGPGSTMDRRDFLGYPKLSCSSIGCLLLSSGGATYIVARGFNPGSAEGKRRADHATRDRNHGSPRVEPASRQADRQPPESFIPNARARNRNTAASPAQT